MRSLFEPVLAAAVPAERDELLSGPAASARVHPLPPLGDAAVAELVRRRLPVATENVLARCAELTGGTPLYVRAMLRALEQQDGGRDAAQLERGTELAARSVVRWVWRRLAAMSEQARALARAVAVFEQEVALHQAAALECLDPRAALDAAEALIAADVLRPSDALSFIHPLLRAAVYERLPLAERAHAHRQAARLLPGEGASIERVSAHLLQSAPHGDAAVVDALREAASRAFAQGAPDSAARYLARALA